MIRIGMTYRGRVQGVGFRATTRHVARDLNVVGWVRNEPDGSVRLEVQGEESEVQCLLDAIQDAMGHLISGSGRQDLDVVDQPTQSVGVEVRF